MSTYYDFMVEAKSKDKWYNIDLHTKDVDGKLRHQYLATFSRSFIGQLENLLDDICDYLTVHELLELPYTARNEYVLYRWSQEPTT